MTLGAGSVVVDSACRAGSVPGARRQAAPATEQAPLPSSSEREYWLDILRRLSDPVLSNLTQRRLKAVMPVEAMNETQAAHARHSTHLEAFARLLCGIAPWLELRDLSGDEEAQRAARAEMARAALDAATDPKSPDFLNYSQGIQPLVDTAFLGHALLRAPDQLWRKLPRKTQSNVAAALKASRAISPLNNNWLLFAAMVEAALAQCGEEWRQDRVSPALEKFRRWYVGDGAYSDGPEFRWDYYNSFVIQPMLLDVLRILGDAREEWNSMRAPALAFARRYAEVQERMISPEGTIPPIGRSITYRFGALQLLGQIALMRALPESLQPAQVRCAMTAVLRRMMDAPGTFDEDGWLRIGLCGHQVGLAEVYISTGSLYLCAAGLLPLGLPPEDPFWADPAEDWTARKLWSGQNGPADRAVKGKFPE